MNNTHKSRTGWSACPSRRAELRTERRNPPRPSATPPRRGWGLLPSWEGCRASGGVGSAAAARPGQARERRPRALTGLAGLLVGLIFSVQAASAEPIHPVPANPEVNPMKAELGRRLFHDTRLSKDNSVSCASCHDLNAGGDDGQIVSTGINGRQGLVNSPTVFNSAFNFRQFWDGRAHTLIDQIDGPIQSNIEMESIWPDVVTKLFQDDTYPGLFQQVYGAEGKTISRQTVKDAIAEFMESLTTPNSRFDRWLAGEEEALSAHEKEGYALFKRYGCASCHQGANVGGNMFQVFGVINDYFKKRGNITEADLGRFNVTGNVADRHAFKVPSLRMAAHTAPYLHDGNAETLREAVDIMFEFQLGREAPDEHKDAIVAFIKTLAGEYVDPNSQSDSEQTVATATAVAQSSRGKGRALDPDRQPAPAAAPARGSRGKGGAFRRPAPPTAVAQGNR